MVDFVTGGVEAAATTVEAAELSLVSSARACKAKAAKTPTTT